MSQCARNAQQRRLEPNWNRQQLCLRFEGQHKKSQVAGHGLQNGEHVCGTREKCWCCGRFWGWEEALEAGFGGYDCFPRMKKEKVDVETC